MGGLERIYCEIIQKEPKKSIEQVSSVIVIEPPTIYIGKTRNGKIVSIKEDASDPLNLEVGKSVEIERTTLFLGMIPKDKIVYPNGRKKHIYMTFLK